MQISESAPSESASAAVMENIIDLDGLTVGLILDPPVTAELFQQRIELAVVSDFVGFSAFARLVDSSNPATVGFLPTTRLDEIKERYGHKAKNPMGLMREEPAERVRPHKIDQYCSLLSIGLFDRRYARKFILFVPALTGTDAELTELWIKRYVDAAMCVAFSTRARSIYFAGFGGTDGSFSNDAISRLVAKIYMAQQCLKLQSLQVYFKYSPILVRDKITRLVDRLAHDLYAEGSSVERLDRVTDTMWLSPVVSPGLPLH